MKNPLLRISLLLAVITFALFACAPSPTLPPPTLTPSPIPPTITFTPEPTATPTPTLTATPATVGWILYDENEWITLSYPPDWNVEDPREGACYPPDSSDCIIRLSHSPDEKIMVEIVKQPAGLPVFESVEEADQYYWNAQKISAMIIQAEDSLKLISRTYFKVDGLQAVRRLYEYPQVNPSTYRIEATQYTYEVLVLRDGDLYFVRMETTSSEEFNRYLDTLDWMVETIVFRE